MNYVILYFLIGAVISTTITLYQIFYEKQGLKIKDVFAISIFILAWPVLVFVIGMDKFWNAVDKWWYHNGDTYIIKPKGDEE